MNMTSMFDGFRRENMKNDFLAIQMEALASADQRDLNVNLMKDKEGTFTDAAGEAIEVSSMNLEGFDALAEEALGTDGIAEIALESPDAFNDFEKNSPNKTMMEQKAKLAAQRQQMEAKKQQQQVGTEGFGPEIAAEGSKACTCGECEECTARQKASEEWEFGSESSESLDAMIAAIPESSVTECVETINALNESMDGTREQKEVRESLSAQIDLLIPSY